MPARCRLRFIGKHRVLVFAGGESRPPAGGLMCIDPADGKVDFSFPWRGTRRESVNASSPVVIGNQVFISECYGAGGVLLNIETRSRPKPVWENPDFGTHFMTAIPKDGYLYGVDGHGPEDAFLCCIELSTGHEMCASSRNGKRCRRCGMERSASCRWGLIAAIC